MTRLLPVAKQHLEEFLAEDIQELENIHKPIELAHQISRREFKDLATKMRRISVLAIRCAQRFDALQDDKESEDKNENVQNGDKKES